MSYVKFELPKDLENLQTRVLEEIAKTGKIKAGINEVTKAVERGNAKLVVIAKDVSPEEIVMHLPLLCAEKNIAFTYAESKLGLGKLLGENIKASSIAVLDEGKAKKELDDLIKKLKDLAK